MVPLFFEKTGAKRRTAVVACNLLLVSCFARQAVARTCTTPRDTTRTRRARSCRTEARPSRSWREPCPRVETAGAVLDEDELLHTGKINGQLSPVFPFAITRADLDRGEERFNIYCSPCHGRTGEGNGMVVQRGYRQAANYHIDRLRAMPVGYFVDVMTNGFGAMPDYRMQIMPADRWRVAAYVRALQLSHAAAEGDVPAAELEKLKRGAPAPAAAHGSEK